MLECAHSAADASHESLAGELAEVAPDSYLRD